MKDFFNELLQFNNYFNQKIINVLNENPEKVSDKCLKLVSHVVNVHCIWNDKIQGRQNQFERWVVHPIKELNDINNKNHEDSSMILETYDLNQTVPYSITGGKTFNHAISVLLFQIINHSTYHRGQIATEFRQNGLEPLLTEYIFYKMTQTE
jgi:uncharacterized damage-inducible protein DinB